MKILELRAENVKRLKAIEIRPDPDKGVVIVGGSNGHGKTSCLDSIFYALGGKGALPPKPVRDGAEEATITVDVGDYVITRTISADGKSSLKVTGRDGGRFSSPQTILDGLVGNLSFDPLTFARMEPAKQLETLKALVGLDFSSLDRQKATAIESRVLIGREHRALEARRDAMPRHADAPLEEVSIAELTKKLRQVQEHNRKNDALRADISNAAKAYQGWADEVSRLETELAEARKQMETWKAKHAALGGAGIPDDIAEAGILEQINSAETLNRKYRDNAARIQVSQQADQKAAQYKEATDDIAGIDAQKARRLQAAKFPVPGLAFDDAGVTVNGIPFQQASAAEQVRVSVAMGLALNPKLKVLLVRDGSLLDAKSMELIAAMAAEHGGQLWIERVSTGAECTVVIEDGEVKATPRGHLSSSGKGWPGVSNDEFG